MSTNVSSVCRQTRNHVTSHATDCSTSTRIVHNDDRREITTRVLTSSPNSAVRRRDSHTVLFFFFFEFGLLLPLSSFHLQRSFMLVTYVYTNSSVCHCVERNNFKIINILNLVVSDTESDHLNHSIKRLRRKNQKIIITNSVVLI